MLMRSWTVAVGAASLLALTLVTASAAPSAPAVWLSITKTGFYPDEDTGLPAGKTYWFFTYRVAVHSDEPCSRLTLNWRYRILSDGRLEQAGAQDKGSELAPTPTSDQTFPIEVGFGPSPGEVVALHAVGRCVTSDGQVVTSAPKSRAVQIPPFSCQQGPLRVAALRGRALREQPAKLNSLVPIHRRDFLWTAYTHILGRRSRIVFGAPECDHYRVVLTGSGGFDPGTYARHVRGDGVLMSLGMAANIRGDQHSGGLYVDGAYVGVQPLGDLGGRLKLADYKLRSWGSRESPRTRLMVRRGGVLLAFGRRGQVLVHAPADVVVTCHDGGESCRLSR